MPEVVSLALTMSATEAASILDYDDESAPPPYIEPLRLEAARIVSDWTL